MMRLAVFGATGGTGRALVEQALTIGHEVTAFARSPDRLGLGAHPRLRTVVGDALDGRGVDDAVRDQDAVLSALGTRPWRHQDICSAGTTHIVAAMRARGVRRLIALSSLGVGDSRGRMSRLARAGATLVLRHALEDKHRMETMLRDGDGRDLDWVVVRPAVLLDATPRAHWRVADDGTVTGGCIGRADVAAFMLEQLDCDIWLRRAPVLAW
jgi:nucleoside-diphosphate-sugar epimerase